MRKCGHCQRPLTPQDFDRAQSKAIEAERRSQQLPGVRFRFYTCSGCGYTDIFVDVLHLHGEADDHFVERKAELESVVHGLHEDGVEIILSEKGFRPAHH